MNHFKEIVKQQSFQLYFLLALMSVFNIFLVVFRLNYVGFVWGDVNHYRDVLFFRKEPTFIFLIWNLLLAWIPFCLAILVNRLHTKGKSRVFIFPVISIWLLFFPNAPYLLTDLLHLHPRSLMPYWYDGMLFTSFALTGLLLGLLSLYPIHRFIQQYLPKPLEHGLIVFTNFFMQFRYLYWSFFTLEFLGYYLPTKRLISRFA